jgi:hypothetical protein
MLGIVKRFLELDPTERMLYQVGRRMGLFRTLDDLNSATKRHHVKNACDRAGISPENVEEAIDELMKRFI